VRAAPHITAIQSGSDAVYTASEALDVLAAAQDLVARQYTLYNRALVPALAQAGIRIVTHTQRTAAQRKWVQQHFRRAVKPLLVPVALDPAHPFPQVANKSLNLVVRLRGDDAFGRSNAVAIVKLPRA